MKADKIEEAISNLLDTVKEADANEALKFTQAALNLAHVSAILSEIDLLERDDDKEDSACSCDIPDGIVFCSGCSKERDTRSS